MINDHYQQDYKYSLLRTSRSPHERAAAFPERHRGECGRDVGVVIGKGEMYILTCLSHEQLIQLKGTFPKNTVTLSIDLQPPAYAVQFVVNKRRLVIDTFPGAEKVVGEEALHGRTAFLESALVLLQLCEFLPERLQLSSLRLGPL